MKLFRAEQIKNWDQYTMEEEPIASIDLMERAAAVFTDWLEEYIDPTDEIHIICGPGNNGGDGLAVARLLAHKFYRVNIYLCHISSSFSEDNQVNQDRLPLERDIDLIHVKKGDKLPEWRGDEILVDALFGSGLSRPIKGYWAEIINRMNTSSCAIYAVDVPSGMYSDRAPEGIITECVRTLSFELPKRSFFHSESGPYAGKWTARSIGLHPQYAQQTASDYHLLESPDVRRLINDRDLFSHKGTYGHALLLCGSTGMLGAAQLASRSVLRAGAGKVTLHCPANGLRPLQTAVPEAMISVDSNPDVISSLPDLTSFDVVGMGCGVSQDSAVAEVLIQLLEEWNEPLVLDADALNLLANTDRWQELLPKNSVLTPHPGECDRLLGPSSDSFERLDKVRTFAKEFHQYVVLKGAYTRIVQPDGTVYYNSSGNPGLASAGSGDVLTGLITGWLAQGYSRLHACLIGVHQHGLAAERLNERMTLESMTAGDIIEELPYIFS